MTDGMALIAPAVFDGDTMHRDTALVIAAGRVQGLVPINALPKGLPSRVVEAAVLAPGFVDWQVNGGGGVLLNDVPTVDGVRTIAQAHARFGTTALLPTVITDAQTVTERAADTVGAAIAAGVPGIVGIHFEGPHISPQKNGVHDARFIRPLAASDIARLTRSDLGVVVATLAPECVDLDDIALLAAQGVIVSLGHSAADFERATAAFSAGARAVTHLFNAMSGLHHREPGLAGAALANPAVFCGLIADGHHVHPAMLDLVARTGPVGRLTLVTDAMSSVGCAADTFELNGRTVRREGGRLTVADGTLAGSDLDMASAVRFMVERCGVALPAALAMASRAPAALLGLSDRGHLRRGASADIVALNADLTVASVLIGGRPIP
ncbi:MULTISPECIES: N-acetylglucosamine-6-phosphate deacetylase [unclassified Stappia]|uniref:N-acetylglucosamine-6-phosphate deacetylase n=1 Tax=unclassified Stappia TaxID=2629676 RepID=UPI001645F4F2|nr:MULTISPECIES: N-acetylglucosamine-6-phosphate deacetylase [unclassified Stappia]